jgi:hypothetical protein
MKLVNVGISIAFEPNASIWSSGLNQNLAFLVLLLRKCPRIGKIFLINGSDADTLPQAFGFDSIDVPLVRAPEVTYDVDLVIEFGASLPLEWLRHVRALGAKVVVMLVGHTYSGQAEMPLFGRSGGAVFIGSPWHEVWTLPQHMKTSAPMLRTVARVPVKEVPHIWDPLFLERQIAEVASRGLAFGFEQRARQRPDAGWRLAIFEPNISVVKNCFIPMLACDSAYRRRREAVSLMMVMNSFHMKEHVTFNTFALHLDLTRDGKASYEPRIPFAECMAVHHLDAVISHQWECGLNYAYYDALYGGYPLIHNSEFLAAGGAGLYYPGFEANQGGQAILDAWAQPTGYWDDYRRNSLEYLKRLSPQHEANIESFARHIASVMGDNDDQA